MTLHHQPLKSNSLTIMDVLLHTPRKTIEQAKKTVEPKQQTFLLPMPALPKNQELAAVTLIVIPHQTLVATLLLCYTTLDILAILTADTLPQLLLTAVHPP